MYMGPAVTPHKKLAHMAILLTPAHTDTCNTTRSLASQTVLNVMPMATRRLSMRDGGKILLMLLLLDRVQDPEISETY
jgi:hypothetical protein